MKDHAFFTYPTVLTPDAIEFINQLTHQFRPRLQQLLQARQDKQKLFDAGDLPNFREETKHIREAEWKVAPIPQDLLDRRVEITGPVDRKMIINALNSGANVFMADMEDSNVPDWSSIMQGHINLMDAVRHTITFTSDTGKEYRLNDKTAVLMMRPRGWHMVEKHFQVDGEPVPASLFDFGLYFFHNVKELLAQGTGPYFYLPKMERYEESRLWNDVFMWSQEKLGIPVGTIRATCLIETITAIFEMDEILWELREHSLGLNCGRWDMIFSFIKKFAQNPNFILPDRSQVVMGEAFLDAYCKLLVQTCHKRGTMSIGGMAAQIPIKNNPEANEAAMEKVRADKLREVRMGCDGAWISHPGLLSVVREVFDQHMPTPNQIDKTTQYTITQEQLLDPHRGTKTEEGLRHNIRVGIQYLEAWLRGIGCVPIYNLMEDMATAEISRAQVWQWLHYQVEVGGEILTQNRFEKIAAEEMKQIEKEVGPRFASGQFTQAFELFMKISTTHDFVDFLTLPAYDLLK